MPVAKTQNQNMVKPNPLDIFEDLLESSGYDYDRVGKTRLHFDCEGRQGSYGIMLEWNEEAKIIKSSLVISATKPIPYDLLNACVTRANEAAWHGFFIIDGVGNSVFKSLIRYGANGDDKAIEDIETMIDIAVKEADRFSITLALSNDNEKLPSLFQPGPDDEWSLENLTLMLSETKGNA